MRRFFAVCCILIITGNYNYLCGMLRVLLLRGVFRCLFRTESPPPQIMIYLCFVVFSVQVCNQDTIRYNFVIVYSCSRKIFLLVYIYTNRNRLSDKVLEWGVSGNVADLAHFNA